MSEEMQLVADVGHGYGYGYGYEELVLKIPSQHGLTWGIVEMGWPSRRSRLQSKSKNPGSTPRRVRARLGTGWHPRGCGGSIFNCGSSVASSWAIC